MLLTIICIISAILSCSNVQSAVVWEDNFDGTEINDANWQFEVGGGGWGNNELEHYTSHRRENAKVENGSLVITAVVEKYGGNDFTSARMLAKKSFTFGKFEARAKLPKGKQLWPAIWMMPQNWLYGVWAASGEIDIMELRGDKPDITQGSIHYGGTWPNNSYSGSGETSMGVDLSLAYHTYTLDWTNTSMSWSFDGKVFHTENIGKSMWGGKGTNPYTKNGSPFDQPFHYILNIAVGGSFFPSATYGARVTVEEAKKWAKPTMEIDYVRVSQ